MIFLSLLKHTRQRYGLTARQLSAISGVAPPRLAALETVTPAKRAEPWLDEAYRLARVLGTDGILPLVSADPLAELDPGIAYHDDVEVWSTDARVPLSMALRLTIRFGLDDPEQLIATSLQRQLWDIMQTAERASTRGNCIWCDAAILDGEPHQATCLPDLLYGKRGTRPVTDLPGQPPRPRTPGKIRLGSGIGYGLKALRLRWEQTQEQFAEAAGFRNPAHYSRVERGLSPLTFEAAERISAAYKVDVASLYQRPGMLDQVT